MSVIAFLNWIRNLFTEQEIAHKVRGHYFDARVDELKAQASALEADASAHVEGLTEAMATLGREIAKTNENRKKLLAWLAPNV